MSDLHVKTTTTNTLTKGVTISVYYNNVYSNSQALPTIYEYQYSKEQHMEYSGSKHHKSVSWTNGERKFLETNTLENKSSRERKFPGQFALGSECFRVRKFQRTKFPGSGSSKQWKFQGANWPGSYWNFRSMERFGPGAKRLGTRLGLGLVLALVSALMSAFYTFHMHIISMAAQYLAHQAPP